MAEFIDVIHTIQRICKRRNGQCSTCLMGEFACPNSARFDKTEEAAFRELEDVVVKWAEENPEPVYPTWYAWLANMGIVPIELPPDQAIMVTDIGLLKKIPADIAQKLGLQPKE